MGIHIDDTVIEQVRDAVDIVDLISNYLPLERSGANYLGLCPFHNEKTPSFTVSAEKQFYHCFGCGASGDALEFVMERNNLPFPEAIKFLADKYGVQLKELTQEDKKKIDKSKRSYELNREVAGYFLRNLENNKMARSYLEARSIDKNISRRFGLGYAKDSWDDLHKYLLGRGYESEELEELGLIAKRRDGSGYYDRFRNRIIFPIIDTRSRVIGFGGRVLDDQMPKYLNSKETLVFNKGNHLYGLNMLERYSKRNDIILVEGYMDVISLFRNGIESAVASLGTALTKRQASLLGRYGDVYICYDSDQAGIEATNKAITTLLDAGVKPRIILLGDYKDPDDFFEENNRNKFEDLIDSALHFMDYKIYINKKRYDLNDIEDKIKFTVEIAKDIRLLKNSIEMDVYINKLSEDLNISKEAIEKEVYKKKAYRKDFNSESYKSRESNQEIKTVLPNASLLAEIETIRLMIYDKKYCEIIESKDILPYFENETTIKALETVEKLYVDEEFIDKDKFYGIMEGVPNINLQIVRMILDEQIRVSPEDIERFIDDLIRTLKVNKIKKRRKVVRDKIKELDKNNSSDTEESNRLLMELTRLNEEMTKIRYE